MRKLLIFTKSGRRKLGNYFIECVKKSLKEVEENQRKLLRSELANQLWMKKLEEYESTNNLIHLEREYNFN